MFYERFMSDCQQFWGSRGIRMARKTRYRFESYDPKLVVFVFYGHFHEFLPTVLGFHDDLHVLELQPKTSRFFILCTFSWVIAHSFAVPERFTTIRPDTCLRTWPKTCHFRVLWPFSWAIAHSFRAPRRFTFLRVMTKNSSFFCFMAIFMSYCP